MTPRYECSAAVIDCRTVRGSRSALRLVGVGVDVDVRRRWRRVCGGRRKVDWWRMCGWGVEGALRLRFFVDVEEGRLGVVGGIGAALERGSGAIVWCGVGIRCVKWKCGGSRMFWWG